MKNSKLKVLSKLYTSLTAPAVGLSIGIELFNKLSTDIA